MKAVSPEIRTHRVLGRCCILHSFVAIFGLFCVALVPEAYDAKFGTVFYWSWWIFATSWFLWPLVLFLHPARSWRRVIVPLGIGYLFYVLWGRLQSRGLADLSANLGVRLGEDLGMVDLTPHNLAWYAVAYAKGLSDGSRDAKSGHLILEAYGFGTFTPSTPNFCSLPQDDVQRCGIEFNHVTGCVVNTWILGHSRSYNKVMMTKIRKQCPALVKAAEDEEVRNRQASEEGENRGRADAQADLKAGQLAIVVDDSERTDDVAFKQWLREKYQLDLKRVYPFSDLKTSSNVFGYKAGYNAITSSEIERRFGKAAEYEIWEEWFKIPKDESGPAVPH